MPYVIARPINGISLNGDEYARDPEGTVLEFNTIEEANEYLTSEGITEERINAEGIYIKEEAAE